MPYKPKPHYGGPKPATAFRPGTGPRPAGGRGPRPFVRQKADDELNINEEITASQVRLVGDNIAEPGIYPISKALKMADELSSISLRSVRRLTLLSARSLTTRSTSTSRGKRPRR